MAAHKTPVLPEKLHALLLELRLHGIPIGLRQFQQAHTLCLRLSAAGLAGTLVTSLGALLARDPDEAQRIEALLARRLRDPEPLPSPSRAATAAAARDRPRPDRKPRRRLRALVVGSGLGLILVGVLNGSPPRPRSETTPTKVATAVRQPLLLPPQQAAPDRLALAPGGPLALPAPPRAPRWRRFIWLSWLPTLALLAVGRNKRTRRRQEHALQQHRDRLEALPGPTMPVLQLRNWLRPALPRATLDDLATILGRLHCGARKGRRIDPERTVQSTAQRTGLPTLVYHRDQSRAELLILIDCGRPMRLWERKARALTEGLQQRGVALRCLHFDSSSGKLAPTASGTRAELAELLCGSSDLPVLLLSIGPSPGDGRLHAAPWLTAYRALPRRVWLHPLRDSALWHSALRESQAELSIFPMTAAGMLAAARQLAAAEPRPATVPPSTLQHWEHRLQIDAALLARLSQAAALTEDAEPELLELLRQQLCPELPEEALAFLYARSTDGSGTALQLSAAEAQELRSDLRRTDAQLPLAERLEPRTQSLLTALWEGSEPDPRSLANLRWRLRCAVQRLQWQRSASASIPPDSAALATVRELLSGPLYEEARDSVRRVLASDPGTAGTRWPPVPAPSLLLRSQLLTLCDDADQALQTGLLERASAIRSLVRAAWSPLLLTLGLCGLFMLAAPPAHQQGYELRCELDANRRGHLRITARAGYPDSAAIYRDAEEEALPEHIRLVGGQGDYLLAVSAQSHAYQVRSQLPAGNIAYSPVCVMPPLSGPGQEIVRAPEPTRRGTEQLALPGTPGAPQAREPPRPPNTRPHSPRQVHAQRQPEPEREPMLVLPASLPDGGAPDRESGGPADGRPPDAEPSVMVTVTSDSESYYLDRTEVTVQEYERCVAAQQCDAPAKDFSLACNYGQPDRSRHPINCVDKRQAAGYCAWVGKRLPTESQWEYAAASHGQHPFPWGSASPGSQLCWRRAGGTCPVGSFPGDASPEGVLDLAGNVREWVADADVARGGTWHDTKPQSVQAGARSLISANHAFSDLGFRCARAAAR